MDWLWIIIVAVTVFVMVEVGNYILKGKEVLDRKNPAKLMGFS
jgi:hypothetical protein